MIFPACEGRLHGPCDDRPWIVFDAELLAQVALRVGQYYDTDSAAAVTMMVAYLDGAEIQCQGTDEARWVELRRLLG